MLKVGVHDVVVLGAALGLGENIAGSRFVEHQRRGVNLGESASRHECAGIGQETGVAQSGQSGDHFDRGVLERGADADAVDLRHIVEDGGQCLAASRESEDVLAVDDRRGARLFLGFERAQNKHRRRAEIAVDGFYALLGDKCHLVFPEVGEIGVGRGDVQSVVGGHSHETAPEITLCGKLRRVLFDVFVDLLVFHCSSPSNLLALALM